MRHHETMPTSHAILAGAVAIANEWRTAAVAWHVALAVVTTAVVCGWRPSNRVAGYALSAPFLSVSAAAWTCGNPFNGTVFAALFLVLLALAKRLSREPVRFGGPVLATLGAIAIAFGSGYPHFLETDRWTTYVYASPLGVLPCPTLSAVIGATLLFSWALLARSSLRYGPRERLRP